MRRRGLTVRQVLAVLAVALVAGTAAVLGLAAAADAWTHDGALVLVALAAVWLPMMIAPLVRAILRAHHLDKPSQRAGLRTHPR